MADLSTSKNHIILVGDESSSMRTHASAFVKVFDALVADLAVSSKDAGQETRISFYSFANYSDIRCLTWDMDVLRMPSIGGLYNPHGLTALIDASCLAIDDHSEIPVKYGDHSFLMLVLTDGIENDSRRFGPTDLSKRIAARPLNWTFGIFVPDRRGMSSARDCGFPEDNVSIWNPASSSAMSDVGSSIRAVSADFMAARSRGERKLSSVFRVNEVSATDVSRAELTPLTSGSYAFFPVLADCRIDDFVAAKAGAYRTGRAFYQLTKTETVQGYKEIAIRSGGAVYTGIAARSLLGLPAAGDAKVKPAMNGCEVFVQSTSHNRKLLGGTEVLVLR